MKIAFLVPLLLTVAASAQAQQTIPEPGPILNAALQTMQALDQNQAGQIWEGASPIMKLSVAKAQFVAIIAQKQAKDGKVLGREWQSLSRIHVTAAQRNLPVGEYLNVTFSGLNNKCSVTREAVSFVWDKDKIWRLAGYNIQ